MTGAEQWRRKGQLTQNPLLAHLRADQLKATLRKDARPPTRREMGL